MLKTTATSSLSAICEFIDNRLILVMAEKKLRQAQALGGLGITIKEKYRLKDIDGVVMYTERDESKASMIVTTTEKQASRVKMERFGIGLRKRSDTEVDIYVDTLKEAINKGILSSDMLHDIFKSKYLAIAIGALLLLGFMVATGGLVFFLLVLVGIVTFPIQYLVNKKRFADVQAKMSTLLSIFEAEFQTKNKADTGDSVTFFGKVKSATTEAFRDISVVR